MVVLLICQGNFDMQVINCPITTFNKGNLNVIVQESFHNICIYFAINGTR